MAPPLPRDPRAANGVLLVGPGPRALDLAAVLSALGAGRGVETHAFGDLAELALEPGRSGLLLLDVDAAPTEDVGYVRRFLAAHPGIQLVLLGSDPRSRTARILGTRPFSHWPPDVEELAAFVAAARQPAQPSAAEASGRGAGPQVSPRAAESFAFAETAPAGEEDRAAPDASELEQVRAILEQGGPPGEPRAVQAGPARSAADSRVRVADTEPPFAERVAEPRADLVRADDFESAAIARELGPEIGGAAPAADAPDAPSPVIDAPPWWRAQVADLADAAQRIDLSVKMLAAAAPEIDEGDLDDARARLRELEGEVARLLQFTRTLGYVAAPPPAGSQTFDLGEIVHLFAAGLAQSGPEAPRCQFKSMPGATVRSDRQLLSQGLDALFFLVRCTSRKGDLVRAQVQRLDEDGRAWIELALDFPSGPLEGFPAEDIVTPYGLTDLFPELGPNALAAAAGIVAGQGGRLSLENRARGRMTWHLLLPRAGS
ncbi:MAG: hypothetical protein NTY35_16040 [Planctomycetota bacterium]|nr:hypothetical protein [Planctomycetota bacterium]